MNSIAFILPDHQGHPAFFRRYICLMRTGIMFLLIALSIVGYGQNALSSLTEEFPELSARERARIAKKEAKEASNDVVYQNLMIEADSLFRLSDHGGSMEKYHAARKRRPYNVHPKVKIQDLQALIDKELEMNGELANTQAEDPIVLSDLNAPAAEKAVEQDPHSSLPIGPNKSSEVTAEVLPDPVDEDVPEEHKIEEDLTKTELSHTRSVTISTPDRKAAPISADQPRKSGLIEDPIDLADIPEIEDGLSKEVYREANAVITKLTVVREGRTDVFKKVYHQWGYVFYFKNGSAITERMWQDETLTFY